MTKAGFRWRVITRRSRRVDIGDPSIYTNPWVVCILVVMIIGGRLSADDSINPVDRGESALAGQPVRLDHPGLAESSGLAFSRRTADRLWTHNDSGGKSILYAFDTNGRHTGSCQLDVTMTDWEDMASFNDNGQARLLVADCGDNRSIRESITLHLFDEPDPDRNSKFPQRQSIVVTFSGGPCDCEAIGVDVRQRQIILVAKTILSPATVYRLPLPQRPTERANLAKPNRAITKLHATAVAVKSLGLPLVTGLDIDDSSGDVWLTSYFQAFRFRATGPTQVLRRRLSGQPEVVRLPKWKQIEAIAVDSNRDAWVTTEGVPAKLGRLSHRPKPPTPHEAGK